MQIFEKIKAARLSAGLTEDQMAERLSVKRSTYQYWEQKTPSVERIKQIAKTLELSEEYFFLNGDENVVTNKDSVSQAVEHEPGKEAEEVVKNGELIKNPSLRFHRGFGGPINFYDVDFLAGNIDFYEDRQLIKPAYTMDIPEFSGCVAFRVYNDSMEPLIKSGSIVFGTKVDNWREYLDFGQIYGIVRHDQPPLLKYIRRSPIGSDHLLLKSENKDYDDSDIPVSQVKSIWLIHGWINKRT